jgi:hypothetical protein
MPRRLRKWPMRSGWINGLRFKPSRTPVDGWEYHLSSSCPLLWLSRRGRIDGVPRGTSVIGIFWLSNAHWKTRIGFGGSQRSRVAKEPTARIGHRQNRSRSGARTHPAPAGSAFSDAIGTGGVKALSGREPPQKSQLWSGRLRDADAELKGLFEFQRGSSRSCC